MVEPAAGARVDRYELLWPLGRGGMGEVWAAAANDQGVAFRKIIALKLLRVTELPRNVVRMFFDEARAAALLQHAAIVPTLDFGRDEDLLFIAMELVRGPSLLGLMQELRRKGQLMPSGLVAHVGLEIADALDYAHSRATLKGRPLELVHRDVSPQNILLDTNGTVRLSDFGVARSSIQLHESTAGFIRGKPSYMAPEVVLATDVDARADVFSLGVVLYECALLERLFGRSEPGLSMEAVLDHEPTPLTELLPGFSELLWIVIRKAIEKDPADRFQSAKELCDALRLVCRHLGSSVTAPWDLQALIEDCFPVGAFDPAAHLEPLVENTEPSAETRF